MTSLYNQSVPVLVKYLHNLSALLTKGSEHCVTKQIKPEEILNFRLIEDMRPLIYQVQSCCNTAKFLASRLGGNEDVFFPDDETTFEQLQTRIKDTVKVLEAVKPEDVNDKEDEEVMMATKMGTYRFTGQNYVSEFAIPNFHFHMSTAYCIMRHLGVNIGAFDYLGNIFHKV